MSARKPSAHQRLRHSMVTQWRGVEDGPLIDLPARGIAEVLGKVVKDLGLKDRLALEDVLAAWREVAGEFIGKNSQPDNFARGILQVRVIQPSIHHALMMEKPSLLKRLNEHLGAGVIRDIRFRHG